MDETDIGGRDTGLQTDDSKTMTVDIMEFEYCNCDSDTPVQEIIYDLPQENRAVFHLCHTCGDIAGWELPQVPVSEAKFEDEYQSVIDAAHDLALAQVELWQKEAKLEKMRDSLVRQRDWLKTREQQFEEKKEEYDELIERAKEWDNLPTRIRKNFDQIIEENKRLEKQLEGQVDS